jgi:hypothetical protein
MEWWLISKEDMNTIKKTLEHKIKEIDDQCFFKGHCVLSKPLRDALHSLDSGCHKTEALPDDFKEKLSWPEDA